MNRLLERRSLTGIFARTVLVAAMVVIAGCGSPSVSEQIDQAAKRFDQGKNRDATVRLKNILQSHGENGRAWLLLARVSLDEYRYADAVHQFDQAQRYGQDQQAFALDNARALIGDQQYDAALQLLGGYDPSSPAERLARANLRGRALYRQGDTEKAEAAFAAALEIEPDNVAALVGQARIARQADNVERARALAQQALTAHPDAALAASALGRIEYAQGDCQAAETHFTKALGGQSQALRPVSAFRARSLLADCQLRSGDTSAASDNVALLMKIAPDDPYANYLQAMIDIRNRDYGAATTHLQNVLRRRPASNRAKTVLAAVKITQGDPGSARLYLQQVLAQSPGDVRALRMQAGLLLESGKQKRALKMVRAAYNDQPGSQSLRKLLAQTLAVADAATAGDGDGQSTNNDAALQLDLANILRRQGNQKAARSVLANVEPNNQEQALRKGAIDVGLDLAAGKTGAALQKAEQLVETAPKAVTALLALARVQWATGHPDQAYQAVLKAQQQSPGNDRLALMLADIAIREKRFDAAEKQLRPVLDRNPKSVAAIMAMAKVYAGRGQGRKLVNWLHEAHAAQSNSRRLSQGLIKALIATDAPGKAVPVVEKLVADHRDDAALLRLAGAVHFAAGDKQQGVKQLQKAAKMASPDHRPAYSLALARAQIAQGDAKAAIQSLRDVRRQKPGSLPAARLLASVQLQQGEVDAALATADSLSQGESGNKAAAKALRGDILFQQKRYREASRAYATAFDAAPGHTLALRLFNARRLAGSDAPQRSLVAWLKQTPQDQGVRLRLAQWYQHNDRAKRARKHYRAVLSHDSDNPVALNNLALLVTDRDKAVELAQRAHRAAPDSAAIADTLGWLRVQRGEIQAGLSLLQQAAEKAASNAEIRYHYAYALAHSENANEHKQAAVIIDKLLQQQLGALLQQRLKNLKKQLPSPPENAKPDARNECAGDCEQTADRGIIRRVSAKGFNVFGINHLRKYGPFVRGLSVSEKSANADLDTVLRRATCRIVNNARRVVG